MATLRDINASTLGTVDADSVYEAPLKWTHGLYQATNVGLDIRLDPESFALPGPMCLGLFSSLDEAERRRKFLSKHLKGPIYIFDRKCPVMFAGRTNDHMSQAYIDKRRAQLMQNEINKAILKEEMWTQDMKDKNEHLQTKSDEPLKRKVEREARFIDLYNQLPWVQLLRSRYKIDADILVKPGAAYVAVNDTRAKHRLHAQDTLKLEGDAVDRYVEEQMSWTGEDKKQARAQKEALYVKLGLTMEEADDRTFEGNTEFPPQCKMQSQTFLICSVIVDDTTKMEPMIVVYGHCTEATMNAATKAITHTLAPMMLPLNIGILPMYQWLSPYDLAWNGRDPKNSTVTETAQDGLNEQLLGQRTAQNIIRNKIDELLHDERVSATAEGRMFKLFGITELQYTEAVNRLGKEQLNARIFDLPSVKRRVAELSYKTEVLFSDIFTPQMKLTDEDRLLAKDIFREVHTDAAADAAADALLQSMLA